MNFITVNQNFFEKYGNNIYANSKEEFVFILNNINDKVPEKTKGRTQDDIERHDILHYLKGLCYCNFFDYPIEVIKCESPDLIIKINNLIIGVEHTCATNEEIELFKRDVEKSDESLFLNPRGYFGKQVEYECSEMLYYSIFNKTIKLNTDNFKKFKVNELLIYYDGPFIGMDIDFMIKILKGKITKIEYNNFNIKFDKISMIISYDLHYDIFGDYKKLIA